MNFAQLVDLVIKVLVNFDYSKLIPEHKSDGGYQHFAFPRVELTLRYTGPGIGFGLGYADHWFGWPKKVAR